MTLLMQMLQLKLEQRTEVEKIANGKFEYTDSIIKNIIKIVKNG